MSNAPTAILLALFEDIKTVITHFWRPAFVSYSTTGYTKQYYLYPALPKKSYVLPQIFVTLEGR